MLPVSKICQLRGAPAPGRGSNYTHCYTSRRRGNAAAAGASAGKVLGAAAGGRPELFSALLHRPCPSRKIGAAALVSTSR